MPQPHRFRPDSSGFTLVELLAVIAIIAVLAAISIPVVSSVRASARDTQCLSNLRQIATAFNLYRGDHKGMPPLPIDAVKSSYESRSVWEYGSIKAVGLGRLQYEGFIDSSRAQLAVTGENRSQIFNCPERDSGNGWAYAYTNWIDYSYLVAGTRCQPVLEPGLAIAADVAGGLGMTAGEPTHGANANVAYADGSVSKVPYARYSSPNRSAESFDRTL